MSGSRELLGIEPSWRSQAVWALRRRIKRRTDEDDRVPMSVICSTPFLSASRASTESSVPYSRPVAFARTQNAAPPRRFRSEFPGKRRLVAPHRVPKLPNRGTSDLPAALIDTSWSPPCVAARGTPRSGPTLEWWGIAALEHVDGAARGAAPSWARRHDQRKRASARA